MQSGISTDRPFLIAGGMGGELGASAIQEFVDRPPKVFRGASSTPRSFPPPDKPCSLRLPDWFPASKTQTRHGGSQPAGGGTIIFEGVEDFFKVLKDFAPDFQSTPPMGVKQSQKQPKNEWRVILWSRNDDPSTLRAFTIGKGSQTKGTKLVCEEVEAAVEPVFEIDFAAARKIAEQHRVLPDNVACSLAVWTLWTNPQYR
jgi:hypothetical protein